MFSTQSFTDFILKLKIHNFCRPKLKILKFLYNLKSNIYSIIFNISQFYQENPSSSKDQKSKTIIPFVLLIFHLNYE
jgi:hypothetical protein